ncbi:unnamed protein product [Leuciscus chuanchicus]
MQLIQFKLHRRFQVKGVFFGQMSSFGHGTLEPVPGARDGTYVSILGQLDHRPRSTYEIALNKLHVSLDLVRPLEVLGAQNLLEKLRHTAPENIQRGERLQTHKKKLVAQCPQNTYENQWVKLYVGRFAVWPPGALAAPNLICLQDHWLGALAKSFQYAVSCIRAKFAVQVKPLGHSVGVSVGTGIGAPCLTSTPIKRPRMEDTVFYESSTYTSNQCSDVTYEPDVTQESIEKEFPVHQTCEKEESGPKMLLCHVYGHLEPYFMEPCDSRLVGIYKAQISQTRMKNLPEELLIICDAANLITNVEAKWPGSVHDSRMYRESTLSNRLERGEIDGFLLGDRGYPCRPTLITPYPEPEPGSQRRFNVAHCRTRARVEMTIGLLKARFQCLRHLRRQLFHRDGHHPNKLGSRVLKDNIYFSLNHPSAVCANPLNQNGTHTPGHSMNDHRTSLQNGHDVDISHKDNDNTTEPQQPLLTDTISAEPCPQSSPQTDILELLQDSAPKDDFLENSQGSQDSISQPPITPEQQPLSPDTFSLSPATPLLCFSQKMEELVHAGTRLSHSFAASPQISTKKRRAPLPPKPAGPAHPPPASVRALRPLPQRQGSHPPPSARATCRGAESTVHGGEKSSMAVGTRFQSAAEATTAADTKAEAVPLEAAVKTKPTTPAANAANPCVEIVRGEERSLALTVKLK